MKQSRGLFDLSYRLGDYLLMVIRLHFLWFFLSYGGESFLASFQRRLLLFAISLNYLQKKLPLPAELYSWFKQQTAKNFGVVIN